MRKQAVKLVILPLGQPSLHAVNFPSIRLVRGGPEFPRAFLRLEA